MIGIRVKGMFFDDVRVLRCVDRATKKVLSKFGAFVRTGAKRSIRKRRRVSEPGKPPSSHSGLLKRFIFFAYEPRRKSVVIGPAALHSAAEAPELLEYGGKARRRDARTGKTVVAKYAARPFMGPAFEAEKPELPAMWADSVK